MCGLINLLCDTYIEVNYGCQIIEERLYLS